MCYIWCVGNCSVSRSVSSEEPLDGPSNNAHLTFLPPVPSSHPDRDVGNLFLKHHKVQKQHLDNETSKSRSDDANNKTRINTKRPTVKPARPGKPTDPPFIGDSYMSEDVPPQTVSSPSLCLVCWLWFHLLLKIKPPESKTFIRFQQLSKKCLLFLI